MRWVIWWHHAVGLSLKNFGVGWICANAGEYPAAVWLGAECFWKLAIRPFNESKILI